MITKNKIIEAQKKWGDGIVKIGALMNDASACIEFATSFINSLYDFKNSEVLFKPTRRRFFERNLWTFVRRNIQ